ncbi:phenylalanine--tRNA ligase subunit beta [candidate division KSB1 bacterium]|nr:MAG: phenylalanine--tRNA ligase subunit beta [candidate division KSB1 bacterium]
MQMTPNEILNQHPKGVNYKHLMDMYVKYPILTDANGLVLSMPPIINSDATKCKIGTRRLFVDVTGLSAAAVVDSLVTLVSALAELGGEVKSVRMNYPNGAQDTPDLTPGAIDISYDDAKKWLGLPFNRDEFMHYLRKMRLNVTPRGDLYEVTYPAFRTDIRHEVDVFEDLAIGFGYEKIEPAVVPTLTIGEARPEEKMSTLVRQAMIGLGYTEIMTLLLQSVERHFTRLNLQPDSNHVIVENPKTVEQKVVRNHMLTGILETFNKNRRKTVPQKIFEIGNVVHLNAEKETGTDEYRHLAFSVIGPDAGYAAGRMTLDAILHELGWRGDYEAALHPSFTEGRCARITNENGLWALLGEIHPQVLNNFGLAYPVLYCEMRLMQVL